MKVNGTKGKILDVSIKLFNEKKSSNVSTVQISTAMKISPGNLYYYYANKEEVIRCIWNERMLKELNEMIIQYESIRSAGELLDFLEDIIDYCMRYRFFYTEKATLFANDELMTALYEETEQRMRQSSVALYGSLAENGSLVGLRDNIVQIVVDNGIILISGIIAHIEMSECGDRDKKDIVFTVWKHIICYLEPLFTDKMRMDMKDAMLSRGVNVM